MEPNEITFRGTVKVVQNRQSTMSFSRQNILIFVIKKITHHLGPSRTDGGGTRVIFDKVCTVHYSQNGVSFGVRPY
jgi:hypothetical protein